MFKVHNGLMPSYFANVFHENADVHNYNTRHAHDYHKYNYAQNESPKAYFTFSLELTRQ